VNRVARSVAFSFLGLVWPLALALATVPIIAHGLGNAAYGVQALVANVVGYLTILNSLQTAGAKYLSEYVALGDQEGISKLLSTSFIFSLGVGLLGGGIIFGSAQGLATSFFVVPAELQAATTTAFRLAGVGFCLTALGWWGSAILVGVQRYDWLTTVTSISATLSASGSLLAILSGGGLVGVVLANVCGAAVSVILYAWCAHRLLPSVDWRIQFDRVIFRRVIRYGVFSTAQACFGVVSVLLDSTLLGIWVGVAAVTTYSVPLGISGRIHQLCATVLSVVFPVASELDARGEREQLKRVFLRAQNLNVALVAMIAAPCLVLAGDILRFWMGPEFALQGTRVFQLLTVAYGLFAFNVVSSAIVAGLGHPEVNTAFGFALAVGNLVGYVLFIPRWGVDGAGVASVLGSVVAVPAYLYYVNHRFVGIPWRQVLVASYLRALVAGLLVGGALFLAEPMITSALRLALILAGSVALYGVISFFLGVWDRAELALARTLWQHVRSPRVQAYPVR
jgi:O-antigen/teichoic acid export membrane protein